MPFLWQTPLAVIVPLQLRTTFVFKSFKMSNAVSRRALAVVAATLGSAALLSTVVTAQATRPTDQTFVVTDQCASLYLENSSALSWDVPTTCGPVVITGPDFPPDGAGAGFLQFTFEGAPGDPCNTLLFTRSTCDAVKWQQYECQNDACTVSAWSEWGTCEGLCGTGKQRRNRTVAVSPAGVPVGWAYALDVEEVFPCTLRDCEVEPPSDSFIQWAVVAAVIFSCLFIVPLCVVMRKKRNKDEGNFAYAMGSGRKRGPRRSSDSDADESDGDGDGGDADDPEAPLPAAPRRRPVPGGLAAVDPGTAPEAFIKKRPAGSAAGAQRTTRRVVPAPLPEDRAEDAAGVELLPGMAGAPPAPRERGDGTARTIDTISTAISTERSER